MAAAHPTCPFDYLIVVDFEATCDDKDKETPLVRRDQAEIIEVPHVIVHVASGRITRKAQRFCAPQSTVVTPFCEDLTGITASSLAGAGTLAEALWELEMQCRSGAMEDGVPPPAVPPTFCIVCDGRWDLGIQLPRECREKGICLPEFLGRYYDVKVEFSKWARHRQAATPGGRTIHAMCQALGIMPEGRAHSGLDDSCNIARIVMKLLDEARTLGPSSSLFSVPEDTAARLRRFSQTRSRTVMLRGLAFRAREEDIVHWFEERAVASPPSELRLITDDDGRSSGNAFAVFPAHEAAERALVMNGLVMGGVSGRYIEVYPALDAELASAANLQAFPRSNALHHSQQPHHPHQHHPGHAAQHQQHTQGRHNHQHNHQHGQQHPNVNANTTHGGSKSPAAASAAVGHGDGHGNSVGGGIGGHGSHGAQSHGHGQGSQGSHGQHQGSSRPFLPGDWRCACGHHNFARRGMCEECGAPRAARGGARGGGSSGQQHQGSQGSSSQGGAAGSSSSSQRAPRPPRFLPGDWNCPCGRHNFARRRECSECGAKKPDTVDAPGADANAVGSANPSSTSASTSSSSTGASGASASGASASAQGSQVQNGGAPTAEAAGAQDKGKGGQQGPSGRGDGSSSRRSRKIPPPRFLPGDWFCSCSHHNFARRSQCESCGAAKPAEAAAAQATAVAPASE